VSDHSPAPGNVDVDALLQRYRIERERRASAQTQRHYRDIEDFTALAVDPHAVSVERAPLRDTVDVLVVGGGFGGLLVAAQLRQGGVRTVRIVEAGSDVGGTWYWNRYPGAACDVESYIYLPLLEETGYMPVERYSKAAEIRAHAQRIARHFGLYDNACLATQVNALVWDASSACWRVTTNRGDDMRARFVVLATGPLNRPKLPDIPGIEHFQGHAFHTSRWDYQYTGGSATEPLQRLRDKRVAIIGTGATAVQCIPPLAQSAKHLYVFQRTPSSISPRNNSRTDPAWVAGLQPGWQRQRMASFTEVLAGNISTEDLVGDGWTVLTHAVREMLQAGVDTDPAVLLQRADLERMAQLRERVQQQVHDPATAAGLKPWYSLFCKRPCFHDEYLEVFNRSNVTLVDTAGCGVTAIDATAVIADGRRFPVDCLIFATGFDVSSDFAKRASLDIIGVAGLTLTQKWASGMATLHGMHARGFPNCFIIGHAQSGMSANFPHMLSEQAEHIAYIVDKCNLTGIRSVEASAQAEQLWVDTILRMGESRRRFLESCTPGYYNNEGEVSEQLARSFSFGAGPVAFIDLLRGWRQADVLEGLELDATHSCVAEEKSHACGAEEKSL
jgi:cyclohexanone monooxygenase